MKVLVLGSAAAGELRFKAPQRLRNPARTLSALAISADGERWALINASPDIRVQLRQHETLCGDGAAPAICAVVLTSAGIDAAAGLLSLRDGPPIDLYATPSVFDDLTNGLPLLSVLQHYCGVRWHLLGVAGEDKSFPFRIDGLDPLQFEAFALPGLAPPYSTHRNDPGAGDHIALRVVDPRSGRRLTYAPGLAGATGGAIDSLHDADCLLLDGSAWPRRHARSVAKTPTSTLPELLQRSRATRKVLLHLKPGDPLLDDMSPQRARLQARGIEVGYDGMEITL
jgi:pyrroloquinoline quinone biosynthesis protein B